MILIIYAHPYPRHSHANKRMLEQARTLDGVEVRSLYQLYPDFNIDIAAEQEAISRADLVVWQHPLQWYSVPPLLKLWMDKVLTHGWAYGEGGTALHGKHQQRTEKRQRQRAALHRHKTTLERGADRRVGKPVCKRGAAKYQHQGQKVDKPQANVAKREHITSR